MTTFDDPKCDYCAEMQNKQTKKGEWKNVTPRWCSLTQLLVFCAGMVQSGPGVCLGWVLCPERSARLSQTLGLPAGPPGKSRTRGHYWPHSPSLQLCVLRLPCPWEQVCPDLYLLSVWLIVLPSLHSADRRDGPLPLGHVSVGIANTEKQTGLTQGSFLSPTLFNSAIFMFVSLYVMLILQSAMCFYLICCISPHIFLCSTIFLCFFFLCLFCCHSLWLSILFILPCSVKVREGSNYWGPLGYEALISPKSPQSPDPRAASKRVHIFKFRKRTDSKIPLCQRPKRWAAVLCVCT